MVQLLPHPPLLGLPDKFPVWRPMQPEAVVRALDSPKRFVVMAMPTGFGKSLAYMAAATLDAPTAILTSTPTESDSLFSKPPKLKPKQRSIKLCSSKIFLTNFGVLLQ